MKKLSFILSAALIVSACSPSYRTYYATGASLDRTHRDTLSCEVKALKDAPVANEIRYDPGYFHPEGFWIPGPARTVDRNAGLRAQLMELCMGDLGYQPVRIPICSPQVAEAAPVAKTTRFPQLSDKSCVIRNADDSIQIVNAVAPNSQ